MRIFYILPYLESGGTEKHVLSLIRAFKQEHQVVLAAPEGLALPQFLAEGISYYPFTRLDRDFREGLRSFKAAVREAVETHGVEIIHVHASAELMIFARQAIKGLEVPMVFTVHGYHGNSASLSYFLASRIARRYANRVICVAESERRCLLGFGLPGRKLEMIYNGVSVDPLLEPPALSTGMNAEGVAPEDAAGTQKIARLQALRKELGFGEAGLVIGAVGRLETAKGLEYLIKAFARIHGELAGNNALAAHGEGILAKLVIVGTGSLENSLKSLAAELGVDKQVIFTGYRTDAQWIMALFDIFALPSLQEALPLVGIEAMALGKPVVGSTADGIPELVVDGETGYLVPPKDVESLASRLRELCVDPGMRRRMGQHGRERYLANFTQEIMCAKTLEVYRKAKDVDHGKRMGIKGRE